MNCDPLEVALREVTDTKRLLDALITSSESFDYLRAKATLEELRLKVRVLSRVQAELSACQVAIPDHIIPFPLSERAS
jgi:hypothetical protein